MTSATNSSAETTCGFAALRHTFTVTAFAGLARHLERVLGTLRVDPSATVDHRYTIVRADDASYTLRFDGNDIVRQVPPATVYGHLFWHVNRAAIDGCDDRVLLHSAGAVGADGRAVILPAAMEAGKTTLVAGLVRAGYAYLSDEAVGIDVESGRVLGYPKPLSVDRGSWSVLPELRPRVEPDVAPFVGVQWQVPASDLGVVTAWAEAAIVVVPHYRSGGGAEVSALNPAETLVGLAENSFNLHRFGRRGFATLATLARRYPGYRLVHGDLDQAVAAIGSLVGVNAPG